MVKDSRAPQGAHRIVPVNVPAPIAVACDKTGAPIAVCPHPNPLPEGEGMKPVGAIQSMWRIDDEWWRDRPISRLYYSLLMEDGRLMTVFQDLEDRTWWEQRY